MCAADVYRQLSD